MNLRTWSGLGFLGSLPLFFTFGEETTVFDAHNQLTFRMDHAKAPPIGPQWPVGTTITVQDYTRTRHAVIAADPRNRILNVYEEATREHQGTGAAATDKRLTTSRLKGKTVEFAPDGLAYLPKDEPDDERLSRLLPHVSIDIIPPLDANEDTPKSVMSLLWPGGSLFRTDLTPIVQDIESGKGLPLVLSYLNPDQILLGARCDVQADPERPNGVTFSAANDLDVVTLLEIAIPAGCEYSHTLDIAIDGRAHINDASDPTSYECTSQWTVDESISVQAINGDAYAATITWLVTQTGSVTVSPPDAEPKRVVR